MPEFPHRWSIWGVYFLGLELSAVISGFRPGPEAEPLRGLYEYGSVLPA